MKKNIVIRKSTYIPIYGELYLTLVVARDAVSAYNALAAKILLNGDVPPYSRAFSARVVGGDNGLFAVFFHCNQLLTHRTVGHEIDHLVGYMLRYIGHYPDDQGDEPRAYLNGWLHGWVYGQLKKAGLKCRT